MGEEEKNGLKFKLLKVGEAVSGGALIVGGASLIASASVIFPTGFIPVMVGSSLVGGGLVLGKKAFEKQNRRKTTEPVLIDFTSKTTKR